jgi:uncharacterized protein (TIGR04222 family)
MNPFDLRGPQFLAFYGLLAAAVLLLVHLRRRAGEPEGFPRRIDDPYQLAALRDGADEAIRTALLALLDRRLLKATDGWVEALSAPDLARRPLEQAVLAVFRTRRPAEDALKDANVRACTSAVEEELVRAGLVLAPEARGVPGSTLLGAAVLVGVAAIKILVALSRGRTNVGFLVFAAFAAFVFTLGAGARPRRTRMGDKAIELAGRTFGRLKGAAASMVPGGQTNELALAFAVFGAGVLPPLARDLMSEARLARDPGGSSGSSCSGGGSSCGGSSCGGGCGGGGCGGGCGG